MKKTNSPLLATVLAFFICACVYFTLFTLNYLVWIKH